MGGILFLVGILVGCAFYIPDYKRIIPVLFVTLGFGLIGFLDDYIKVVMKRNLGLTPAQKMLGQIVITAVFAFLYGEPFWIRNRRDSSVFRRKRMASRNFIYSGVYSLLCLEQ